MRFLIGEMILLARPRPPSMLGDDGNFPNNKIDELRRFATEYGPKIVHFRLNLPLKRTVLKSSCFH